MSGGAEIIAQRRGKRGYGGMNHEPACVREIGRTAPRIRFRTWWRRNRKVKKVGMSLAFGFVFIAKVGIGLRRDWECESAAAGSVVVIWPSGRWRSRLEEGGKVHVAVDVMSPCSPDLIHPGADLESSWLVFLIRGWANAVEVRARRFRPTSLVI
jgi:hypothetical protein